jgi:hypothetical protein
MVMTNGKKLDIDRLTNAINLGGYDLVHAVLPLLREEFPEVLWTVQSDGRLDAEVITYGYRP